MTKENNKKRFHESALFKRKALLEISKGQKPKEVIISKTNSSDKKYSSKMYYKWKKEVFSKVPDMQNYGFGNDFCNIDINYELSAFEFNPNIQILLEDAFENEDSCYLDDSFAIFSDEYLLYNENRE